MKRKNPFESAKPRDQWRRPKLSERARGRVKFEVCVGYDKKKKESRYALFVATLTSGGLRVHRVKSRKKSDKVWPLPSLANGVNPTGQMTLV